MLSDVFGRWILVERQAERWEVFFPGAEGKKRFADGITIPASFGEDEIGQYLDELCHEWASAKHPGVRRLD